MGVKFIKIKSLATTNANPGGVAFDRVRLVHNDHVESGVSFTKGVSQLDSVVVTSHRTPDDRAIEEKDALLCVSFDGVWFRVKPSSGGGHD